MPTELSAADVCKDIQQFMHFLQFIRPRRSYAVDYEASQVWCIHICVSLSPNYFRVSEEFIGLLVTLEYFDAICRIATDFKTRLRHQVVLAGTDNQVVLSSAAGQPVVGCGRFRRVA